LSCYLEYTKLGLEVVGFALGDAVEEAVSAGTLTAAVAAEALPEVAAVLLAATSLYTCLQAENDPAAEGIHEKVDALDQEYSALKLALEAVAG
jgi:hypothetical protein